MALQKQTISVPFAQGIDTKTDDKGLQAPALKDLRNGVILKTGALAKRKGYQPSSNNYYTQLSVAANFTELSSYETGFSAGGEAIVAGVAGSIVLSQAPTGLVMTGSSPYWVEPFKEGAFRVPPTFRVKSDAFKSPAPLVVDDGATVGSVTSVISEGIQVLAWVVYGSGSHVGSLYYLTMDPETGMGISPPVNLDSNVAQARVSVDESGRFIVCWSFDDGATGGISTTFLPPKNPVAGRTTTASIVTDIGVADTAEPYYWDMHYEQPASKNILVYTDSSSGTYMVSFDDTGLLVKSSNMNTAAGGISVVTSKKSTVAAWMKANGGAPTVGGRNLDGTLSQAFAAASVAGVNIGYMGGGCFSDKEDDYQSLSENRFYFFVDEAPSSNQYISQIAVFTVEEDGTKSTLKTFGYGATLAGKPFAHENLVHVPVRRLSFINPGIALVNASYTTTSVDPYMTVSARNIVANAPTLDSHLGTYTSGVPDYRKFLHHAAVGSMGYGHYSVSVPSVEGFHEDLTNPVQGIRTVSYLIDNVRHTLASTSRSDSVSNTGGAFLYNGAAFHEVGFFESTDALALTSNSTGGSMSDGDYSVVAIYVHYDEAGNRTESSVSAASAITLSAGTSTQTIEVTAEALWLSGNKEDSLIEVYRTADGGSTYYMAGFADARSSSATVSISLTISDSDLTDNRILYTDGGILGNAYPGSAIATVSHKERIFIAADDGSIWFSKKRMAGLGIAMSDSLTLSVPTAKKVIALASLDGRLFAFTESSIFYFEGDGPNDLGQGSFSPPRQIATPVGAIKWSPTLSFSGGVLFVSDRGIELLGRDLNVSYIGAPVEEFLTSDVSGMSLLAETSEILISTTDGPQLTYNYLYGQWGVHSDAPSISSGVFDGKSYYMSRDSVFVQADGYLDGTNRYSLDVTTGWFNLAGIQGYQRVYWVHILGEFKSGHTFLVDVYKDYEETASQSISLVYTGGPQQLRFRPKTPKCQAMRFRIRDDIQSGTYESFSLSNLQLIIGVKKGSHRLGAGRTR